MVTIRAHIYFYPKKNPPCRLASKFITHTKNCAICVEFCKLISNKFNINNESFVKL